MWDSVKKNVIQPLGTRIGSLIAGSLVPYGVHASSTEMLTMGIIGLGCVIADLVAARYARKRIVEGAK